MTSSSVSFENLYLSLAKCCTQLIVYHYLKEDEIKDGKKVRTIVPIDVIRKVYVGASFPKTMTGDKLDIVVSVFARNAEADVSEEVPLERWSFILSKATAKESVNIEKTAEMIFRGMRERLEMMPLNSFLEFRSIGDNKGKIQLRCEVRVVNNDDEKKSLIPVPYCKNCTVAKIICPGGSFEIDVSFCDRDFCILEDFDCVLPIFHPRQSTKSPCCALIPTVSDVFHMEWLILIS